MKEQRIIFGTVLLLLSLVCEMEQEVIIEK